MKELIKTGEELIEFFFKVSKSRHKKELLDRGVMVNTKVRRDVMTSVDQSTISIEGKMKIIKFENCTGGVYRAYIA